MACHLLVVEDSRTQAEELRSHLEGRGFAVEVAGDAEAAWARLADGGIDLVLSDVNLPGMSGFELCRRLKSGGDADLGRVPVILMTGASSAPEMLRGMEVGAETFVTKPIDPEGLASRIGRILADGPAEPEPPGGPVVRLELSGERFELRARRERILGYLLGCFDDWVRAHERLQATRSAEEGARRSLRFVQATLDALRAAIAILDERGSPLAVNDSLQKLASRILPRGDREEGPASRSGLLLLRAGGEALEEGLGRILAGELDAWSVEHTAVVDGAPRWYLASVTRFQSDSGPRLVVAHEDITDRKLAELALAESEARVRATLEQLPVSVWTLDRELRFTYAGGSGMARTGLAAADLVGRTLPEVLGVAPDDPSDQALEIHRAALAGATSSCSYQFNGLHWQLAARPHADPQGRPIGVLGVAQDVSDRRRLELQLLMAEKLASVGTLAAGIAHEINNPLAYVLYSLECALEELAGAAGPGGGGGVDLGAVAAQVRCASEGAERVASIVRELKVFARSGDEERRAVSVPAALDAAIRMAGTEIRYRARLVREVAPVRPVLGNEGRLSQVFLNLLVNAAHAIEAGGGTGGSITARVREEGEEVVVEVEDTGCGIPGGQLEHIFDPFFSTKPAGVGSGLGLAICRDLVAWHQGRIEVVGTSPRGTTFAVRLPVAERVPEPAGPRPPESGEAPPLAGARPGRVLVVDDEPALLGMVQSILARDGHQVLGAPTGQEAARMLAEDPDFDLVLCDLMMAGMTGMDLHAHLGAAAPALAGRMVFMTGGAFTAPARDFLARPDVAWIEKPFRVPDLRRLVRERVAARRGGAGAAAAPG